MSPRGDEKRGACGFKMSFAERNKGGGARKAKMQQERVTQASAFVQASMPRGAKLDSVAPGPTCLETSAGLFLARGEILITQIQKKVINRSAIPNTPLFPLLSSEVCHCVARLAVIKSEAHCRE